MSRPATALDARRLRVAAAALACLVLAGVAALSPPRTDGLVLYAAGEGAPRIAQAYTRQTGVPVTVVRLSTGALLARVSAEGRRPGWSLAWFDGDTAAATLDRAGLLQRHATPAAAWSPVGRSLLPADGAWTPVAASLVGVDVALARGAAAHGSAPLGMADPALAGPAYLQVAARLADAGGWPAGKPAVLALRRRGLSIAATSSSVVSQLLEGRTGGAVLQGLTAYLLADRDARVRVQTPTAPYLLANVIVEAAGLPDRRRAAADRFVRYVLSTPTQDARLRDGLVDAYAWPTVVTDAAPPAVVPALAALRPQHLDPYRWGALQADVTDWFETEVAGR